MTTTNNIKPILFSTEMVQAILAGRKTQTRRNLNPQPIGGLSNYELKIKSFNGKTAFAMCLKSGIEDYPYNGWFMPKYEIDDILWVRETWQSLDFEEDWNEDEEDTQYKICYSYKASNDIRPNGVSPEDHHGNWVTSNQERYDQLSEKFEAEEVEGRDVWYPSIHMPKEACRIFLKVTNVRCERLQDISEEDAIAEGVIQHSDYGSTGYVDYRNRDVAKTDIDAVWSFQTLWDSINAKKHPWESNPWVWVYDFERVEKPENFLS